MKFKGGIPIRKVMTVREFFELSKIESVDDIREYDRTVHTLEFFNNAKPDDKVTILIGYSSIRKPNDQIFQLYASGKCLILDTRVLRYFENLFE